VRNLKNYIVKNQLISFFIITFLFTWILWLVFAPLAYSGGRAYPAPWLVIHLSVPLTIYGVFGPAISAIIIAKLIDAKKTDKRKLTSRIIFSSMILTCTRYRLVYSPPFQLHLYYLQFFRERAE
jgi:predicted membrane-bound mannosyltransferase